MPRPPILPGLDWREIFETAVDTEAWLGRAENQESAASMASAAKSMFLDPNRAAALAALPREVNVVAIAEDWCGDVVRWVPVLARLAEAAAPDRLRVRFVTREERPEVFVRFLTNGGEAIPKFIFLSDKFVECGNWGPYPGECRRVMNRGKGSGDMKSARQRVSKIYESDPNNEAAIREMIELIDAAACERP